MEIRNIAIIAHVDHGKTFRHEAFPEYKAQREETPEDIKLSVPDFIYGSVKLI